MSEPLPQGMALVPARDLKDGPVDIKYEYKAFKEALRAEKDR